MSMMRVMAIPADKLGVLEQQMSNLPLHKLKRERKGDFTRLARILKDLKMVPKGNILGLAYGVDLLGATTAFVIYELDSHSLMQVPLETMG